MGARVAGAGSVPGAGAPHHGQGATPIPPSSGICSPHASHQNKT